MATITVVANDFRRTLLARERRAATDMLRAYGLSWQRLRAQLDALTQQMEAAEKAGQTVSPSWLFRQERLASLQRQVETEIALLAHYVERRIVDTQREFVGLAQEQALQLTLAGLSEAPSVLTASVSWSRLPVEALTQLVGVLQDGSPLSSLLDALGPAASQAARQTLITGVATGQGPRAMARELREVTGETLTRSLTIARTETLRSYRESTRLAYEANSDIIVGWVWQCAFSARTCPACLSMHGVEFPTSEPMGTHPNCRCVLLPRIRGEANPVTESGDDWLRGQSAEVQEQVLGKAAAEAYQQGRVKLQDFVGVKPNEKWGTTRYTKSLQGALAGAKSEGTSPHTL